MDAENHDVQEEKNNKLRRLSRHFINYIGAEKGRTSQRKKHFIHNTNRKPSIFVCWYSLYEAQLYKHDSTLRHNSGEK